MRDFPKIDAIFMLTDVVRWEMNVQLFSDLLISQNGIPGTIRSKDQPQAVEFHLCAQDLLYKDNFVLPRIAAGAFWHSLEHIFFLKYKKKIEYTLYGKPSKQIFNYAGKKLFINLIFF
jgi:ribonucleotide monophosphatase NagD (HAD superfamily)